VNIFEDISRFSRKCLEWIVQSTALHILSKSWLQTFINHSATTLFNWLCLTITTLPPVAKIGLAALLISAFWPQISKWCATAFHNIHTYLKSAWRTWYGNHQAPTETPQRSILRDPKNRGLSIETSSNEHPPLEKSQMLRRNFSKHTPTNHSPWKAQTPIAEDPNNDAFSRLAYGNEIHIRREIRGDIRSGSF